MTEKHFVTGRIIAVQEERFRMITEAGKGLLLTLANFAHLPAHLGDLQHTQVKVRVVYVGEPNLSTGVAQRIELIE